MSLSLKERFWKKVDKTGTCWVWTAATCSGGYGIIRVSKKALRAHRVSYALRGINIPSGKVVDHKCRNRRCVRPSHLRLVTFKTNALENSLSVAAVNLKKTHCPRGHLLSGENLTKDVGRRCKTCHRLRRRAWMAAASPEQLEKVKSTISSWRARNPDLVRSYGRNWARRQAAQ